MILSIAIIAAFFAIVAAFLNFVVLDAWAAFDGDPETITLSTRVKRYVRRGSLQKLSVTALLWTGGFGLVYLFMHFILQSV